MEKLHEEARPTTWAEVVGQDKVLAKIDMVRKRGLGGRAFWISGLSGTGKTTIARLIAREVASTWHITEIDATELSADRLRGIIDNLQYYGMGTKGGKAVIVNEAHGLRADIIRRLLVALEAIPGHCVWVFTTTCDGQDRLFEDQIDASPLLSRCTVLELSRRGIAQPMAERLREQAQRAGLDGQPVEEYVKLLYKHGLNMRRCYEEIEMGAMLS
jgi:DNA polymerase III gamma/tau subunit